MHQFELYNSVIFSESTKTVQQPLLSNSSMFFIMKSNYKPISSHTLLPIPPAFVNHYLF